MTTPCTFTARAPAALAWLATRASSHSCQPARRLGCQAPEREARGSRRSIVRNGKTEPAQTLVGLLPPFQIASRAVLNAAAGLRATVGGEGMLRTDLYAQRLGLRPSWRGWNNHGSNAVPPTRSPERAPPDRHLTRRQTRTSTYARRVRRCSNTWATTTTTTTGLQEGKWATSP